MRVMIVMLLTAISLQVADLDLAKAGTGKHGPEDLGIYGQVFPIQEKSLLQAIQAKLQALKESGDLENHQKAIAAQTRDKVMHPEPVAGLRKTTSARSFAYDPSITVPYDLKDHQGEVFHHKGTKINPLDTHAFKSPFLFVDGDDSEQMAWAIKEHQSAINNHKPKIILVKGAPFDLSRKLGLPVYFDQSGSLVKKFGIGQVPARVSQQDKALLIEELKLAEDPDNKETENGKRCV